MTDSIPKVYYTLKELSQMFGISQQAIMQRCKSYDIHIKRKPFPARIHTDEVDKLKLIDSLIKDDGLKRWKIKEILGR